MHSSGSWEKGLGGRYKFGDALQTDGIRRMCLDPLTKGVRKN